MGFSAHAASGLDRPEELAERQFELIVRRLADDLAYGADASRFVGSGIEYAQTRPYVPGDPVRQLDWRVSARTGKPHIKEYEAMKRIPSWLVVDTSESMFVQSTALSKHGMAVWLAAALGLVALRRLSPVAVVSGGDRPGDTRPSLLRGRLWNGLERMRMRLAPEPTMIAEVIQDLAMRSARRGLFVVISDLHAPGVLHALKLTAQRHDVVVLQPIDPAESSGSPAGFFRAAEAETGQSFLASSGSGWLDGEQGFGPELAGAGVDHLALRTDADVITPLQRFLAMRGQSGGML